MFLSRASRPVAVRKAANPSTGDMVSWNSSGGRATGKIERIVREGSLDVPNSSFKINAEQDDPAVLIRVYRNDRPTSVMVGHKMSTLRTVNKANPHHDPKTGRFSSGPGGGETDTKHRDIRRSLRSAAEHSDAARQLQSMHPAGGVRDSAAVLDRDIQRAAKMPLDTERQQRDAFDTVSKLRNRTRAEAESLWAVAQDRPDFPSDKTGNKWNMASRDLGIAQTRIAQLITSKLDIAIDDADY